MRGAAPLLVMFLALLACKTTSQKEAYAKAKPAADLLRAKVVAAAALVEAEPEPTGSTCTPGPKLTFNPKADTHDTDFLMLLEAKRGGGPVPDGTKDEYVDLMFNTPLPYLLRGTGGFYADYMMTARATRDSDAAIQRGLAVKHVVMVRYRDVGGENLDYFLIELAGPTIKCKGTFTAEAASGLGTRTENYDIVTKDKRTGKELDRTSHSDSHDDRKSALFLDARNKFRARMKAELGLDAPE